MARLRGPKRRALEAMAMGDALVFHSDGPCALVEDDGAVVGTVPTRTGSELAAAGYVGRVSRTTETFRITDAGRDRLARGTSPTAAREYFNRVPLAHH